MARSFDPSPGARLRKEGRVCLPAPILAAGVVVAGIGLTGCGDEPVFRPVELDLQGIAPQVAQLEVLWFAGSSALSCGSFDPRNLDRSKAESSVRWTPDAGDRLLTLPESLVREGTIVVLTEDAEGDLLQSACRQFEYADLESPDLVVRLSGVS